MNYQYKPKKALGQNFLKNNAVACKMVDALEIEDDDLIIEIGFGPKALTNIILVNNKEFSYIGIEIDRTLYDDANIVDDRFSFINADILDLDLDSLISTKKYNKFKVIGAIPYNITSPIIHKLLRLKTRPDMIVLMIQKEVANKICAKVPDANYFSYITIGYDVIKIHNVDKNSFYPKPKVDSAIVLFKKNNFNISKFDLKNWEKFLHHAYKNPRKMLNKAFDKSLLEKSNIGYNLRPQHVSLELWLVLYNLIN